MARAESKTIMDYLPIEARDYSVLRSLVALAMPSLQLLRTAIAQPHATTT